MGLMGMERLDTSLTLFIDWVALASVVGVFTQTRLCFLMVISNMLGWC